MMQAFQRKDVKLIFQYINPNKMHKSQSLFYLTTALHVSGVTITRPQEHKTTVTTASGNRYTVIDRCCSYSCFVLLRMGDSDAEQLSDKINSVTCAFCWDLYTRILL
jgi:hypothetical protein